jgi:hypothetical protein
MDIFSTIVCSLSGVNQREEEPPPARLTPGSEAASGGEGRGILLLRIEETRNGREIKISL